jgi:rhodanese-related sulfurtransferase
MVTIPGISLPALEESHPMKTAHDLVNAAKQRIQEISLEQAEEAIRGAGVLLDVREQDEFAAGHLPGAVHIPRGLLEFKLSATPTLEPRTLKVIVYCKTGGRAALAAAAMGHGLSSCSVAGWRFRRVAGGGQTRGEAGVPCVRLRTAGRQSRLGFLADRATPWICC